MEKRKSPRNHIEHDYSFNTIDHDSLIHEHISIHNETEEDENKLLEMIKKKQLDYQRCMKETKKLPPARKKRIRNRHASSISRLRKRLFDVKIINKVQYLHNELNKKEDELKEAYHLIDMLKKSQNINISNSSSDIENISELFQDNDIQDISSYINTYFCDYDEFYTQNKESFSFSERLEINITD